jgi:hypothetical protein
MKTGNTRDPMTREEYSDNDLKRLDMEAKMYYSNKGYRSTYKIKTSLHYAQRIRNRENEILSFQMRMDELKGLILHIIESNMYEWILENEPLENGPLLIENVEYQSIDSFVNSIIHELKMVLVNLRVYDNYSAELFKTDLLNSIQNNKKFVDLLMVI